MRVTKATVEGDKSTTWRPSQRHPRVSRGHRAHRQATNVHNYTSSQQNRRYRPCRHRLGRRRVLLTLAILFVIIFHPPMSIFQQRWGLLGAGLQWNCGSNYLKRASVVSAHCEGNKLTQCCFVMRISTYIHLDSGHNNNNVTVHFSNKFLRYENLTDTTPPTFFLTVGTVCPGLILS